VRVGLDYLAENYPAKEITLCGFSFGARVGLEVGIVGRPRGEADQHWHAGRQVRLQFS
jgi:alpha/beta superfamily hydrolase